MKNAFYVLLSLLVGGVGIWQMVLYVQSVSPRNKPTGNLTYLVVSTICILAAIALGGLFFASKINKEEELHITK